MGLPASQRRILDGIENALKGSDPRLAALFSFFSRLNRGEEMPRVEQVRAGAARIVSPLLRWLTAIPRWIGAPRRARLRTALFFPAAIALVASTVVVRDMFPNAGRCPAAVSTLRHAHSAARAWKCSPVITNPVIVGK